LVKNGVPWDVAHSLEAEPRLAYVIYFGQLEGGVWDWDAMDWEPQKR
jgi:hypothetical protein